MDKKETKNIFHVQGMHCKACGLLITDKLSEAYGILSVNVDENNHTVEIESVAGPTREQFLAELNKIVAKDGYHLSIEKKAFRPKWREFAYAVPAVAIFVAVFVWLQKAGLASLISADKVSLPVAFGVGLVASVSSCLAVVGGLLLSVSANYAKDGEKKQPQILFHFGRLISFFVFGGVIGLVGSAFTLSGTMTAVLGLFVGLVMLSLGINLLDIFPWAKKIQIHLPKFFTSTASSVKNIQHGLAPFLIGMSTFFLPCGFTQSMQIYSLSTGSFVLGALTMTAFALGTLPVLALISFTSVELGKSRWSGVFFKGAGLLVILFALLNIMNSLVVVGAIRPLFNF